MSPLVARLLWSAGALALAAALGFGSGWHFGGLEAEADNAKLLQEIAEGARDVANKAMETGEKIRQAEYAQAEAFALISGQYEQDKTDAAKSAYERALACVRSGKCRVRLAACPVPRSPEAPAGAGQPDDGPDDGREVAATAVAIGAECRALVKSLQAVLIAERR